jgi:two-component system KDP operon response regulator KdpE
MPLRSPSSAPRGSTADQPLVLVVEDEPQMRRFLVSALSTHGFRSVHVGTQASTRSPGVGHEPDLIVADVGHPGLDGVTLTAALREWTAAPLVAVLNPSREEERAAVLDAGANDYLIKPFGTGDLLARVRVWLKQASRLKRPRPQGEPAGGSVRIDRDRRCLIVDGREVHITPLEYRLLETLARAPAPKTEQEILRAVWGTAAPPPVQDLRAHVRQLRQKIERDPTRPRHLVSEPGGAYRLELA